MQSLIADIKERSFKRVYLLYGDEAYLKKSYKNQLKEAVLNGADTMNFHYFEGKGINPKEIIDMGETLPFFSEYRLIIMENSGFFKAANEDMAEYVKTVPESTILVFVETEVDKRGKLYKAVKAQGSAVELARQPEGKLTAWVLGLLKRAGRKITERDMKLLLAKTGNDMENIAGEVEKLICYTMGREVITAEDIEEICSEQISGKIFEMMDAISEKKQRKALELYYDLLTLKEPPMRILFLLARQFNLLMQVKELKRQGCDNAAIAKKAGIPSFFVGKYASQAGRFEIETIKKALTECVETEEAVKTGRIEDRLAVELLIVRYSGSVA